MDKELNNFKSLITNLIGKEELKAALKEIVKNLDDKHEGDKTAIFKLVRDAIAAVKEAAELQLADHRTQSDTLDNERATKAQTDLAAAIQTIEAKLAEVDARMAAVRDGLDADEEKILQRLTERLPKIEEIENKLPSLGERIRDSLELLQGEERLNVEAIDGLKELLEELTKKVSKAGGSSQLLINHWPRHEQFTMDGVATTVTLAEGVAAQGTAIFGVRWQGQTLDMTTHYTVDGNKITLVGITPSSGDIISVTYMS
jgi:chromosome segregation ATPase